MFLPEPGKTAITTIKLSGKGASRARAAVGEQVQLVVNGHALWVREARGELLGTVEPRLARRVIELMGGGNRYEAALVSSADDVARIVIRETYQDASHMGKESFPAQDAAVPRPDLKDGAASDDADEDEADEKVEEGDEEPASQEEVAAPEDTAEKLYFG
jgi:hypothetical protein